MRRERHADMAADPGGVLVVWETVHDYQIPEVRELSVVRTEGWQGTMMDRTDRGLATTIIVAGLDGVTAAPAPLPKLLGIVAATWATWEVANWVARGGLARLYGRSEHPIESFVFGAVIGAVLTIFYPVTFEVFGIPLRYLVPASLATMAASGILFMSASSQSTTEIGDTR